MFSMMKKIYKPTELDDVLPKDKDDFELIKTNKKIEYYNVSCSFDIETTSFYEDDDKRAIMYAWGLGINGKCIIGRTWNEFIDILNKISEKLELNLNKRLIIYVHNLGYEFQFIRTYFEWEKVFALDNRKPVQALTNTGIEFRCSYILSGYSLAKVGEHLTKYPVQKLVGNLDYNLIRHTQTPMTNEELEYLLNDNLVVMSYVQEILERDGDITKLPLTKTGYVRNACRSKCLPKGKNNKKAYYDYYKIIKSLTINSVNEYKQLKRAFQGGFTHANILYSGVTLNDIKSFDFTSSYPFCMVAFQYPMSSAKKVKITSKDEFEKYLSKYCCLFDITFYDLKPLYTEHPISSSKCYNTEGILINNGRVVEASKLTTTCTEQDYSVYKNFYKWGKIEIKNFRIYKKNYLPTPFVRTILEFYSDKTTLKGVEGKEVEYMSSKENVNSLYGMCVTDIAQDEYVYDNIDGWKLTNDKELSDILIKNNESRKRFLFYPWGVWVTAYARKNLFSGILECCRTNDYVYSDTDSLKILNADKHTKYINNYNEWVERQLKRAMEYHKLPYELCAPKTIKGEVKTLGVYDEDGFYLKFKTLGSKRYLYYDTNEHLNLTVSGLNKKVVVPYLLEQCNNDINAVFEHFKDGLYVPKGKTGKSIHTYIDYPVQGSLMDYLGNVATYNEVSGVHMEEADYSLTISNEYLKLIFDLHHLRL